MIRNVCPSPLLLLESLLSSGLLSVIHPFKELPDYPLVAPVSISLNTLNQNADAKVTLPRIIVKCFCDYFFPTITIPSSPQSP